MFSSSNNKQQNCVVLSRAIPTEGRHGESGGKRSARRAGVDGAPMTDPLVRAKHSAARAELATSRCFTSDFPR